MKKVAVFDIDGVVADYEGQLNRVLTREFGQLAHCDRALYSLEERYEKNAVILSRALQYTNDPNFYYPLRPIDPMVDFVLRVAADHEILFLSSRPEASESFTARWLKRKAKISNFILACGVSDKADFILKAGLGGCEFVIDDSPSTMKQLLEANLPAVCYDQQWNQGIFPRMYIRSDGEPMIWEDASEEAFPFFEGEMA